MEKGKLSLNIQNRFLLYENNYLRNINNLLNEIGQTKRTTLAEVPANVSDPINLPNSDDPTFAEAPAKRSAPNPAGEGDFYKPCLDKNHKLYSTKRCGDFRFIWTGEDLKTMKGGNYF